MKIKPKIPPSSDKIQISSLNIGDCFIADGELHMLLEEDPKSVHLQTGGETEWGEDYCVIPVICEITWAKKIKKKKK